MNPQPSKPTITNPMTVIAQSGGDHLGVRPACEPVGSARRLWQPNKIDAPSEGVDTGFLAAPVARFTRREVRGGSDAGLRFVPLPTNRSIRLALEIDVFARQNNLRGNNPEISVCVQHGLSEYYVVPENEAGLG